MQASNSISVNIPSTSDLRSFGMPMPGRSYTSESYRFGFNGQEKNNDISGTDGGHLDFKYRIHDARLGRFLSVDPLYASYPWNSTYAFAENRVIDAIDLEGLEKYLIHEIWNRRRGFVMQVRILTIQDTDGTLRDMNLKDDNDNSIMVDGNEVLVYQFDDQGNKIDEYQRNSKFLTKEQQITLESNNTNDVSSSTGLMDGEEYFSQIKTVKNQSFNRMGGFTSEEIGTLTLDKVRDIEDVFLPANLDQSEVYKVDIVFSNNDLMNRQSSALNDYYKAKYPNAQINTTVDSNMPTSNDFEGNNPESVGVRTYHPISE